MITKKMKVEIWSDLTCVHCYIAKRRFEKALLQFKYTSQIEIIGRSFELAPNLIVNPNQDMYQFLAEYNQASLEQVKAVCGDIAATAMKEGLKYNFDIAKPANSFRAHRLSHLAKHNNIQDQAKEVLFRAHFTEGKNIDDTQTLVQLGVEIGLNETEVRNALESNLYTNEVRRDIMDAKQLNIRGVPYYLFNGKLSVSGAQSDKTFLDTLEKAYSEWWEEVNKPVSVSNEGLTCQVGERCQ